MESIDKKIDKLSNDPDVNEKINYLTNVTNDLNRKIDKLTNDVDDLKTDVQSLKKTQEHIKRLSAIVGRNV